MMGKRKLFDENWAEDHISVGGKREREGVRPFSRPSLLSHVLLQDWLSFFTPSFFRFRRQVHATQLPVTALFSFLSSPEWSLEDFLSRVDFLASWLITLLSSRLSSIMQVVVDRWLTDVRLFDRSFRRRRRTSEANPSVYRREHAKKVSRSVKDQLTFLPTLTAEG